MEEVILKDKDITQKKERSKILEKLRSAKKEIFSRLDEVLLYIILFFTPLFFLPLTSSPLHLNKQVFVFFSLALVLLVWFFNFINTGKLNFRKSLSLKFLFFFLLVSLVSWLVNGRTDLGILGSYGGEATSILNLSIVFLIFFTIQSIFTTKEKALKGLLVFLFGSFFTALVWLFSTFLISEGSNWHNLNTVGSLDSFVLFLLSGFFVGVGYFFENKNILKAIFIFLLLAVFSYAFVLLGFTTSWYILSVGFILFTVLYFSSKENFEKKKFKLFLVLFALIASLVFSFSNFTRAPYDLRISFETSKNLIIGQYEDSLKELFFGSGPVSFEYSFLKYREGIIPDAGLSRTRFSSGYSALTDYFSDLGFVAGSLFILFMVSVVVSALKYLFSKMKKNEYDPVFLGAFIASLTLFVNVVQSQNNFTNLFFAFVLASILLAYAKSGDSQSIRTMDLAKEPQKLFFALLVVLGLIVGLVFLSYQFSQKYVAEIYFKKAQDSVQDKDLKSAAEFLNKATGFYNKDYRYVLFAGDMELSDLQNSLKDADLSDESVKKDTVSHLQYIEGVYKDAVALNEKEPMSLYGLGSLYEFWSVLDGSYLKLAEDYYKKALELDPNNIDILFASGRTYYENANMEEAKKIFLRLKDAFPNDPNVRIYLGLSYAGSGDVDTGLKELEAAKVLDPKNEDVDKLIKSIKENK